jgi:hypothetical protein
MEYTYTDQHFENQTVHVDGNRYVNCTFDLCKLVYSGGDQPYLKYTTTDCYWTLDGAAKRTIEFLAVMYHSEPRGRKFVEHIIEQIVNPSL